MTIAELCNELQRSAKNYVSISQLWTHKTITTYISTHIWHRLQQVHTLMVKLRLGQIVKVRQGSLTETTQQHDPNTSLSCPAPQLGHTLQAYIKHQLPRLFVCILQVQ